MTAPDAETSDTSDAAPQRSVRLRLGLGLVLVLALVASATVLAVVMLSGPRGGAAAEQRSRDAVMSVAEQFMVRVNTYGPDLLEGTEMPSYRERVSAVITPKFDADFQKNVPAAEATVAQAGLSRTAEILGTGVSTIDADSATALVAGSFTNSYPKKPGSADRVDAAPSPFRVQVSLVKIDGAWLVDDFTPVTGLDDEQQGQQVDPSGLPTLDPSLLPSDEPTDEPSDEPSDAPTSGATP